MSEKEQVLDELQRIWDGDARHGDSLHQILAGISYEKAVAKPIAEAHSIWELVLHIAGWNETFAARLAGKTQLEPVDGDFPVVVEASQEAWEGALQRLKRSQESLIEVIMTLDEERFSKQFADRDYTLSFSLHGVVRHIIYHSGQIALLKKSHGSSSAEGAA